MHLLSLLSDPNIAFLLLSIGGLGLAVELVHPTVAGGALGAILLAAGLIALGSLPTNWIGVVLMLSAFALLVADVHLGGRGLLAAGGIVALIAGGLLLVGGAGSAAEVSRWLVFGTAAALALLFLGGISALYRSSRRPSVLGGQTLIGREATVRAPLNPTGYVSIDGEIWKATLLEGTAEPGEAVTILDVHGLALTVWRTRPPTAYFSRRPEAASAATGQKA